MSVGDIKWKDERPPLLIDGDYYRLGVQEVEDGFIILADPIMVDKPRLYLRLSDWEKQLQRKNESSNQREA